jgi:nucleoside-diphosphate-sugar epimerase
VNVLVTGATGFIGSHVVEALVRAGHQVRVGIRASSDTKWLDGLDVERVQGDLRDEDRLATLVEGVDAVVHGAGVTRAKDRETFIRVNAEGSRLLAVAAVRAGVGRFVLLSSLAARGPDQAQAPGDAPVSWYGYSKLAAERRVMAVAGDSDMDAVALRIGGVYGPRDTDLLPLFQSAARGLLPLPPSGLRVQPVYVDDVVSAIAAALVQPAGFGPWPVAQTHTYAWSEMGMHMKSRLDRRVVSVHVPRSVFLAAARVSERVASWRDRAPRLDLRRAEDLAIFSYTTDIADTSRALSWSPEVDIRHGLATTADWYRREGWLG